MGLGVVLAVGLVVAGARVRGLWTPPTATSFDQVFDRMKLELEIGGASGIVLGTLLCATFMGRTTPLRMRGARAMVGAIPAAVALWIFMRLR